MKRFIDKYQELNIFPNLSWENDVYHFVEHDMVWAECQMMWQKDSATV